ncbi:MAG: glutamate--tRNA ligase [Aquisalinus sp.]|nr:glutamate--tRNA ligase [Aquisalinus sp.]
MSQVKVRFAPSPTGKIHVGNVRAALFNWLFAQKEGGIFMLRSDDTDQARSTKEYEDGIQEDLSWLGITHQEFARQSERFDEYDAAAAWLRDEGLLYACYETAEELDRKRKLQRARGLPPVYDRAALDLTDDEKNAFEAEGRRPHWRLKLSQQPVEWQDLIRGEVKVDTSAVSDPVLIREDGQYLYTLPSCVDDVDFNITHVIRGEDHVTNTATQIELFGHLIRFKGAGDLPVFAHHSLLVGADGEGLSKRLGSLSIEGLREAGLEPQAISSLLARLGTADPVQPKSDINDLIEDFSFAKMGRAPARFDLQELEQLNAKILHELSYERVAQRLGAEDIDEALWLAVRGNVAKLQDVTGWRDIIRAEIDPVIEDKRFTDEAAELVPDQLDDNSWGSLVAALKDKTGRKGKQLFMPLRLALTGLSHGPDMPVIFKLIGAEKARARFRGNRA